MKIDGLRQGMVMQRGADNTCHIYLCCPPDWEPASCVVTAQESPERESLTNVLLEKQPDGRYLLTGIPVGGPYRLAMGNLLYQDLYVGDVWLLAGQSNMEGIGRYTRETNEYGTHPNPAVRAFFMTDEWGPAKDPLHALWMAKNRVHTLVYKVGERHPALGVGPGVSFGRKMFEYTGVPQGLIACAHGGTTLDQWAPDCQDGSTNLYLAMKDRFRENGGHVRGMFWYQGCSDAMTFAGAAFAGKMDAWIRSVRRDFGEMLPIVQVQIARLTDCCDPRMDQEWTMVREQQRLLAQRWSGVDTVAAVGYALDDPIHLSAAAQQTVGEDAAESMYCLLFGNTGEVLPGIRLSGVIAAPDQLIPERSEILVTYDNLHGDLQSSPVVGGYLVTEPTGTEVTGLIYDVALRGNTAVIRCSCPCDKLEGRMLYYGYGANPLCTITDRRGRSLPAFGPIPLGGR